MADSPPRIVVVGSANMDLVGLAERLPGPGETVLGDDFVMTPGGKGANQAIAAVRAGGRCTLLAAIGSDSFGVTINARLTELAEDPDAPAMVLVTHHVEEIPRGFTHALLLREGTVVASGLLSETMTAGNLSKTFGLPLVVQRIGDRYTARAA